MRSSFWHRVLRRSDPSAARNGVLIYAACLSQATAALKGVRVLTAASALCTLTAPAAPVWCMKPRLAGPSVVCAALSLGLREF